MRTLFLILSALLISPAALAAQGWIIPRPCPILRCPPPPCRWQRCPPVPVPSAVERTSSEVDVELKDGVLHYEIEETFVNRGGALGEADYLFPMPKGAAFQDLKLSINGELVAGETMSAEEARRIYEDIVRQQRDPALVEWMGYGLLRTRIFPIAAGERKKVVVRFHAVAEREGDALRVDYFRGSRERKGETGRDGRDRTDGRMSFRLRYQASARFGKPYSPTHSVRTGESGGRLTVEVSGDARELTLLLPLQRSDRAAITLLPYAPGREDGFALITLSPPALPPRTTPRDLTFVLDVSGSMSGRKMEQGRAAGKQFLAALSPRDRFRLVDFSSDVRTFRDEFVFATRENIVAAERYLDALNAEGSTNISGALEEALSSPRSSPREDEGDRFAVVLFVTDGEPTVGERRPDVIAEMAARMRGRRRIFTFGVGADLNVALLEQLAMEGRGTAHFVRPDESVERTVGVVATRITSPVMTDVRVRSEGVRLVKMHPAGPIDLFAGQDVVMLGRYEGSGRTSLRFEGVTANGPVTWSNDVEFPERERENAFVARLWATQRIGYLSAEKRKHGGSSEIDDEIRALGERYGIPTEFTSYLVLEPGVMAQGRVGALQQGLGGPGRLPGASRAGRPGSRTDRERAFDAAKQATEQRAARSLAEVDAAPVIGRGMGGDPVRRVGARIFTLRDSIWVDARYREELRTVRVKAFSDAYFRVLELLPDAREALAIGERAIVVGRDIALEIGPEGSEKLGAEELEAIRIAW